MSRTLYGMSAADYLVTQSGAPLPGAQVTVWTARTGGSQVIDMLDMSSLPVTAVTSDSLGFIGFYGPDPLYQELWIDGGSGERVAVRPADLALLVDALNTAVNALEARPNIVYQATQPSDPTVLWVPSSSTVD